MAIRSATCRHNLSVLSLTCNLPRVPLQKQLLHPFDSYLLASSCCIHMQNDLRMASLVTAKLMKNGFMSKIEAVIDKDKKISNRKMAEAVYSDIEDGGAKLKVLSLSESIQTDLIEQLFSTITQSGIA